MATPQDDLTAKLKAIADKDKPSFVAPVTDTPTTPVTNESITNESEPVKTSSVNTEQMDNLIDSAKKANAKLAESQMFDKTDKTSKTAAFKSYSAKVKQILKDNGMDSQQVDKAHAQLMEIIVWGN